ncbi:MAG: thiol-disulfide oxidoreductase DCC family protein [Bacteroidetes bacterium]|nr:MAG: thiol-disulfide oxidoreductase DCC family protein [Bacteroidota bacterium]
MTSQPTNTVNNFSLIIFDGECNFCNRSVQFIIKRDREEKFKFASSQSPAGKQILTQFNLQPETIDTVVLIQDGKSYTKSDAAINIAQELPGFWKFFSVVKIIPRPIRDYFYTIIAHNRYALFGKRDTCDIMDEEQKKRFIVD